MFLWIGIFNLIHFFSFSEISNVSGDTASNNRFQNEAIRIDQYFLYMIFQPWRQWNSIQADSTFKSLFFFLFEHVPYNNISSRIPLSRHQRMSTTWNDVKHQSINVFVLRCIIWCMIWHIIFSLLTFFFSFCTLYAQR